MIHLFWNFWSENIRQAEKQKTCNTGLKSMIVNFSKQETLLIPKIHSLYTTLQGSKNMERETLNGANISNFNCSVIYHQEKELGRMLQRLRNFYGAFKDKEGGEIKKITG